MAREGAGRSSKAAFTKGSTSSAPLAFHRHQQHSMNFFSATSPPAAKSGLSSLSDRPRDRISSASTALFSSMAGSQLSMWDLSLLHTFQGSFDDTNVIQMSSVPATTSPDSH